MSYSSSAYPALQEKRVVPDTASTSQLHTFKNFLLDFSNTIADPLWFCGIESDEAGTVVKNISEHMLRLAPESKLDNATLEKSTSAIMLCAKLKTWARSLELSNGGGCERWRLFYKTNFIAELEYAVNTGVKGELTPGPSSPPSQDDLYEFLKYSALHFFEDAHKVYKSDNADSAAQDARVYVSFAADDLPAFKSVPVQQLASWKHLLQVNIFDTYFETTAKHLAELGFEAALPLPTTKVQSKEPESVLFPFFVSGCDGHPETCGANYSAQTRPSYNTIVHPSPLSTGVTCATALAMLGQLEGISIDDDEEPLFATQPPGIVAMTFVEKHVGVWVVHRIEHRDIYRAGICIWSGDMTKLRDVVELTVIFDKIASWATTTFRSWISDRVAQWISRFSSAPTEGDDDDQLEALGIQIGKLRISRTNSFGVNRRN